MKAEPNFKSSLERAVAINAAFLVAATVDLLVQREPIRLSRALAAGMCAALVVGMVAAPEPR